MAVSESPARVDKTRDHRYRREDAVRAIEIAIVALEEKKATPDQLGDLADAIDALKQGQFHAAALLADGALHAKPLKRGNRPETMSLTLQEMKEAFRACRGAAGGSHAAAA